MRIFILLIGVFLTIIPSCSKDENPEPEPTEQKVRLAKIIDWEAANHAMDSVPEYVVQYTDSVITKLKGKFNDEIIFKYESLDYAEDAFGSRSRLIRIRDVFDGFGKAHDTARYVDDTHRDFISLIMKNETYSRSPVYVSRASLEDPNLYYFSESGSSLIPIRIAKNSDGDIALLEVFEDNSMQYLQTKLEVTYSSEANSLHQIKDMSFIDPSSRWAEGRITSDLSANGFPFSIHYGTKRVSSFKVTSYNPITHIGYEFPKQVSYEINDKEIITKILIDGKPFKEFVYVN